jgi:hypothetical protein
MLLETCNRATGNFPLVESSLDGVDEENFKGCNAVFMLVDFFVTAGFLDLASHFMFPGIILSLFRIGEVKSKTKISFQ